MMMMMMMMMMMCIGAVCSRRRRWPIALLGRHVASHNFWGSRPAGQGNFGAKEQFFWGVHLLTLLLIDWWIDWYAYHKMIAAKMMFVRFWGGNYKFLGNWPSPPGLYVPASEIDRIDSWLTADASWLTVMSIHCKRKPLSLRKKNYSMSGSWNEWFMSQFE